MSSIRLQTNKRLIYLKFNVNERCNNMTRFYLKKLQD